MIVVMFDTDSEDEFEPKTQLETARGGSGGSGNTAIGAGSGGGFGSPNRDWPIDPSVGRPRTIICEKDELLRSGLKAMTASFVTLVAEVSNFTDAMEAIRQFDSRLVIFDEDPEQLCWLEVFRRTRQERPTTNFLMYTSSEFAIKHHNRMLRAGVTGFCLKSSGPHALFEGIKRVTGSLPYCDPQIARVLKQSSKSDTSTFNLTDREMEVLIRVNSSNEEISEELDMKMRTVEKHIECILQKLNVSTRAGAALKAVELDYASKLSATATLTELTAAEQYAREAIRRQSLSDNNLF